MRKRITSILLLMTMAAAVVLTGCSSTPDVPEHKPKLGVAQNSDGIVTFAITTEVGYEYAIYYEDPKTESWKLIPGCDRIKGTGEQVELQKKFNSRGPLPAFTVRHTRIL